MKLLILPSDHLIYPQDLFEKSVINGLEAVENNIITFGAEPKFASVGYGYIKISEQISNNCFAIDKFIEKPNLAKAEEFIKDGRYLWNAGVFLLQADILISLAERYLPKQLAVAKNAIKNGYKENLCYQIREEDYQNADDISIDYGILEKTKDIATTKMHPSWSDLGDFNALHMAYRKAKGKTESETEDEAGGKKSRGKNKDISKDEDGNVTKGDVITYETKNSFIQAENSLITCLGLDNIIAIETSDAILIADKSKSQDVKKITQDFLAQNKDEVKFHNRVHRPWGYYEIIQARDNFKVKRILVNPNSSLSLQRHNFRSEHWVVIKGIATVQRESEAFDLPAGKSTFISIGQKHRLRNKTEDNLEIIEIQMGEKIEESDIERFEDNYGRK